MTTAEIDDRPLYHCPMWLAQYVALDLRRAADLMDIRAISQATALVARAMKAVGEGSTVVDEP